jgi:hypothetical protein
MSEENNAPDVQWDCIKYDNPDNGCPNCGRYRIELCRNGKHRCEKCGWVVEDEIYVGLDIGR